VEVYRTPQTTTQGRNSIAGAIFIETNDPVYALEGRARLIVAESDTQQGSIVLNAPILEDQLAVRIAADLRTSNTWSDLPDLIEEASPYPDDYGVVRAKILAEPRALAGSRFELSYVHLQSQNAQGETVRFPFENRSNPVGGGGVWRTNVDSLTGQFTFDLARDLSLAVTPVYGNSTIERFSPAGEGAAIVEAEDMSIETILRYGSAQAPISGVAGVYAFRSDQTEFIDLSAFLGLGDFTDEQESLGLFGEISVRPAPRLELTGGLRYQRDQQDRQGFLGTPAFGFTVDYQRSFEEWLPKVSLAYEISDDLRVGLLAQRAYNPGGTTISFTTGQQDTFEEETLWTYELFARARTLGGRLTLNGNLFLTDFTNSQRPITTVVTRPNGTQELETQIDNAPSARSYGAEIELGFAATPRLNLRAAIGLLETEIEEALDPADPILGKEFQRAPNFTGVLAVDWRPIDPLRLSAQVRHNGGYFSDDANTPALAIDGSTTVDARAAYEAGPFTAFVYARNLFDDFAVTQLYAPDFGTANDPREIGAGIELRF
jgi:iron complex outermembrane receptor protein